MFGNSSSVVQKSLRTGSRFSIKFKWQWKMLIYLTIFSDYIIHKMIIKIKTTEEIKPSMLNRKSGSIINQYLAKL